MMKPAKMREIKSGYAIVGKDCGRDKNGVFRCVCGKCERSNKKGV